jgi:hypothetical protein
MRGIPVISIVLHVPIAFILIYKAESNNNNNYYYYYYYYYYCYYYYYYNKAQTISFFIHFKKVQRKILAHYYIMYS